MELALDLAKSRHGQTGLNPSVGCVIVKNDKIISIGQTSFNGRPHAEFNAIKNSFEELKGAKKPKVVLSWAPHPRALPQAVPNSFVAMMRKLDVDFCITHPKGYELNPEVTLDTPIYHDQKEALQNADFVYVKNWSSYSDYGKIVNQDANWMMTQDKLNTAKFMHCLPVRRNVVVEDAVLDSSNSVVIQQANNRTFAAQIVLKKILENL